MKAWKKYVNFFFLKVMKHEQYSSLKQVFLQAKYTVHPITNALSVYESSFQIGQLKIFLLFCLTPKSLN